jgi:lipopolysaccharide export system protein LptA
MKQYRLGRQLLASGALTLAASLAVPLAAQQPTAPAGRCQLEFSPRDPTDTLRASSRKLASGLYDSWIGGGVVARCPAQNMTLSSDSAEYFGDRRLLHLIGNVHYVEPRLTLDSQLANYFMAEERLEAQGKVHAVLPSGTTMDGPRMDYYRVAPGIRDQSSMIAPGRPTIKIVQVDSTGKPTEPVTVIANTVTKRGDSTVFASGKVEITRPDVLAKGDSASLDSQSEFARLMKGPSITARGDRPFTLTGTVIDLFGRSRMVERVLSKGNAKSVSDDATLTADTLDFRMGGGRLQRVYGWGESRSRAANPTYDILADSLDVRMPEQRLREVHAVGGAYAQSVPDTTRLHTTEHDWLRGDTIFAYFDSSAKVVNDSASQPAIEMLVAVGHARSYYQIAPRDTAAIGPAINYVRGERINVAFADRTVDSVTIVGQAAGVYADPTTPKADSIARAQEQQGANPGQQQTPPPAVRPNPSDTTRTTPPDTTGSKPYRDERSRHE